MPPHRHLQRAGRPGQELPGRDESRIRLGQTAAGRYLKVIYVPDKNRDGAFVVTAYEMPGKTRRAFRRHQRRKKS
jgi:hypothetical protein